ncbi:OmpA family protein [Lentzea sp.]|uniref:OmpA family protein n=1 Tax=Lentzea sp. TaxID=56099 RepID=UPI002C4502F5|nr:OmpA family protein [Lentzea sp.]HUQ60220.1 OmpA family protein [Lentzea sp.]
MNNDELDEGLKARHRAFVADLAAVLPPARLPVVPPASPWKVWWTNAAMSRSVVVRIQSPRFAGVAAGLLAVVIALGAMFIDSVPRPQADLPVAAQESPDWLTAVTSTMPKLTAAPRSRATSQVPFPRTVQSSHSSQSTAAGQLPGTEEFSLSFAPDSFEVALYEVSLLREIAADVRSNDRVDVIGHTARLGPPDTAAELSLRRANAVRNELLRAGTPDRVIRSFGEGYSQAREGIDPRDRRVVVVVVRAGA